MTNQEIKQKGNIKYLTEDKQTINLKELLQNYLPAWAKKMADEPSCYLKYKTKTKQN